MPTFTPNINLKKPLQTENYNVDDFNGNCDLIDTKIGTLVSDKSDKLIEGTNISLVSDLILKTITVNVSGKVPSSSQADNSTTLLNKTISNTIGNILSLIDVGGGVVGLPIIDGSKLTGLPLPDISGKVNLTDFTGLNQSKIANGWQKLPGGIIIQWGNSGTYTSNEQVKNVVFPLAFPNACLMASPLGSSGVIAAGANEGAYAGSTTKTAFNIISSWSGGTDGTNIYWIAFGH